MKRLATFLAALALIITAAPAHAATNNPPYGFFTTGCAHYDQPCIDEMNQVGFAFSTAFHGNGNGEFTMAMPATTTDGANIAQHARDIGMSVRWNTPHTGVTATDNATLAFAHTAASWAGTHGFYLWDEPGNQVPQANWLAVATWSQNIADQAPGEDRAMSNYGYTASQMSAAASPYANDPNWQGGTDYPRTFNGTNTDSAGSVFGPLNALAGLADNYGNNKFGILKLFSWADPYVAGQGPAGDHYPSELEFQTMIMCARKANMQRIYFWGYQAWASVGAGTINSSAWVARWGPWDQAIQEADTTGYVDPGNCSNNGSL